jgi:hypothetical protein
MSFMKKKPANTMSRLPLRTGIVLLAFLALSGSCKTAPPAASAADDPPMENASSSKEERIERYRKTLRANGYTPKFFDADIIEFRRDGLFHYVYIDGSEPEFVQILLPSFWEIESKEEQRQAVKAASYASARAKGAKVFLSNEDEMDVSIAVELYFPNADDFAVHFPRMLAMLDTGARYFREEMLRK